MANIDNQESDLDRFQAQRNEARRESADRRTMGTAAAALSEAEQIAIVEEQANRVRIRQDDLARTRSGTPYADIGDHEEDETDFGARNRRDTNHLSFGNDEPYPLLGGKGGPKEHVVASRNAGWLYSSSTRILEEGIATRGRQALFGAFSKHETFALAEMPPDKGYFFRRTSKVERGPITTREVKYREDGKTKERVTLTDRLPLLGTYQNRYDYDAQGNKSLTGFKTPARSWFVDKEPGGLVTRTSGRELGGLHASIRMSWSSTDENGHVTNHSALVHRGVGPYSMLWSQKASHDREGNEYHQHVKTDSVGKRGWLFKRSAEYNLETGKKTITTTIFGITRKQRPQAMTDVEKAQVGKRERLRETSVQSGIDDKGQIRDQALQREQRIRMVEAATIYRLPQPRTVRRLQTMVRTVEPERPGFDRAREHLSREQYRAVGAWVNSGGDVPYAKALSEEMARADARGKGKNGSDISSDSGSGNRSGRSSSSSRSSNEITVDSLSDSGSGSETSSDSGSGNRSGRSSSSSRSSNEITVDSLSDSGSGSETSSDSGSGNRSGRSSSSSRSSSEDSLSDSGNRREWTTRTAGGRRVREDYSSSGSETSSDSGSRQSSAGTSTESSVSNPFSDKYRIDSGNEEREPLRLHDDGARARDRRSRARGGHGHSI